MRQYWVMKTGFAMLDVGHAYGLAELLHRCLQWAEDESDVEVTDCGAFWLVTAPPVPVSAAGAEEIAEGLVVPLTAPRAEAGSEEEKGPEWFLARGWDYVCLTNQPADRAKAVARLRAALPGVVAALSAEPATPQAPVAVADFYRPATITTPQGLETAAGKGSRAAARGTYGEGQFDIPEDLWAVSVVGAASVGTFLWPRQGQGYAAILPVPEHIVYENHRAVRDTLRASGMLCPVSTTTALAHYAVRLAATEAQQRANHSGWRSTYSGVVYQGMVKTTQRPKPALGGLYPLDWLRRLVAHDLDAAISLCGTWDKLLALGGMRGMEPLALTLTEFLMDPRLEKIERHWRVHLRLFLAEKLRVLYPAIAIEGVMNCV